MVIVDWNDGWTFRKEGSEPVAVTLPHDAMLAEPRDGSCRNGVNSGYFPGGKYVYEKAFDVGERDVGAHAVLHFEGVYQNCVVWVNGRRAGAHKYGYTPFDVDITRLVEAGANRVRVDVDNSLEPNCRWYSGSGIYRPVTLLVDELDAPKITTRSYDPAVIEVRADAECVEIYDGGELVASGEPGKIAIPNAKLWSEDSPHLYTCVIRKGDRSRKTVFGVRLLEWDARRGLRLNGRRILLRGGCIHHDHGVLGACDFYDAEFRRISILKENGFNAVRIAHNPASQITLDICDRLGMYVMNETFDGWYVPKTYHDYARWFDDEWQGDLTAMVESSYNHPCVIMYSHGNEVSETASQKGAQTCRMLTDFIHSLDDTRPVTAGVNVLLNVYTRMGVGVYRDEGEYKPEPLPKEGGYREKKTGSAFFNAMAGRLGSLMFYMAAGKKGDRACKGAADGLDVLGLNYAASRYDEDVRTYPDRLMVGSETMAADLPYNWERVRKYPQVFGDFVWSAWDYLGEACIGDWTYHSYPGLPLLAGQGMIDITGKPLAAMYFMQVVWGLRERPFIGVRPLNHAHEKPTTGAWQFTNAIDSWTWHGYEGTRAVVEVYAAASSVRLMLNDRVVATKPVKRYKAMFKTDYEPGTLTAVALDEGGREISRHSLSTGGARMGLTLRPDTTRLQAGGQSLCHLAIEFTDEEGELLPYVERPVTVEVEGAAVLQGLGSARCKTDESYLANSFISYRGRLLAVLRSAAEPGRVRVRVSADGCAAAEVDLKVR